MKPRRYEGFDYREIARQPALYRELFAEALRNNIYFVSWFIVSTVVHFAFIKLVVLAHFDGDAIQYLLRGSGELFNSLVNFGFAKVIDLVGISITHFRLASLSILAHLLFLFFGFAVFYNLIKSSYCAQRLASKIARARATKDLLIRPRIFPVLTAVSCLTAGPVMMLGLRPTILGTESVGVYPNLENFFLISYGLMAGFVAGIYLAGLGIYTLFGIFDAAQE